jgi:hypothetical protein
MSKRFNFIVAYADGDRWVPYGAPLNTTRYGDQDLARVVETEAFQHDETKDWKTVVIPKPRAKK